MRSKIRNIISESEESEEDSDYVDENADESSSNDDDDDMYILNEYTTEDELIDLQKLKENNPELHEKFLEVKEYLQQDIPTIESILNSSINIKDKSRIVELYEIMMSTDPVSLEFLHLKDSVKVQLQNSRKILSQSLEDELELLRNSSKAKSIEEEIIKLQLPYQYKLTIFENYKTLQNLQPDADEYSKLSRWLHTVLKIPFGIIKELPPLDYLSEIKQKLDKEIYGMHLVKEKILIYINNKINNYKNNEYCLGLLGKSGVGKTSLILSLSKALDLPMYQLSGGMLNNSDAIHGHHYTYIGSDTGCIIKGMIRTGVVNSIFFIDEFEKINSEKTLDSILQLLDPVQNNNFKDHYIGDIPIDISSAWFICAMNQKPVEKALRDRIYFIELETYSINEQVEIIQNHTLVKCCEKFKLNFEISENDTRLFIDLCRSHSDKDNEASIRPLIFYLEDLCSKILFLVQQPKMKMTFSDLTLASNLQNDKIELNKELITRYFSLFNNKQQDKQWKNMFI